MCTPVYGIIYAKPLGKGGALMNMRDHGITPTGAIHFGLLITSYNFETLAGEKFTTSIF